MKIMKVGAGIIGAIVFIYFLGFLMTGGNLAIYRFWAPQFRDAQREVFEQSQSYVQGKVQYLTRLRLQYTGAQEGPQKDALRTLMLTEASTVDLADLPPSLQTFLTQLGAE